MKTFLPFPDQFTPILPIIIKIMNVIILYALGLLVPTSASAYQYQPGVSSKDETIGLNRIEAVSDSLVEILLEDNLMPGMSVALAVDGKIIFTRAYGLADVEVNAPAKPETVFGISSITKQFTAAAIMRLAEQGKISLDDPVIKYLPDYPVQGQPVTVKHLLNHTSGIRDREIRSAADLQKLRLDLTFEELVDMTSKQPFLFPPGENHDYNNMGYTLLGQIIYEVTEKSWLDYIKSEFLKPLNLENTFYGDPVQLIPDRAEGYMDRGGKLVNTPYISMQIAGSAGSLFSTVEDLVHWTHMLHAGKIVSTELLDQMTTPTVLAGGDTIGYGYGLRLSELGGHRKVYHGGTFGFGPYLAHYPEDGLTIAILTNSAKGREKAEKLENTLARMVLGVEVLDLPLSEKEIASYENTYSYKSGPTTREVRIVGENHGLKAQIDGGKPFRLLYQGNHVFIPTINDGMHFLFTMDNSRAVGFTLQEGPWRRTEVKIKP